MKKVDFARWRTKVQISLRFLLNNTETMFILSPNFICKLTISNNVFIFTFFFHDKSAKFFNDKSTTLLHDDLIRIFSYKITPYFITFLHGKRIPLSRDRNTALLLCSSRTFYTIKGTKSSKSNHFLGKKKKNHHFQWFGFLWRHVLSRIDHGTHLSLARTRKSVFKVGPSPVPSHASLLWHNTQLIFTKFHISYSFINISLHLHHTLAHDYAHYS
jgi:hypothetical protein